MDRFTQEDSPYIIIQTSEPKEMMNGFYRLNLSSGQIELLCEEPRKHYPWYIGGTAFCKLDHKDKLIYTAESENEPPFINMLDIDSNEITKIGDLSTGICPESLGAVRMMEWQFGDRQRKGIFAVGDRPRANRDYRSLIRRLYGSCGCYPFKMV